MSACHHAYVTSDAECFSCGEDISDLVAELFAAIGWTTA